MPGRKRAGSDLLRKSKRLKKNSRVAKAIEEEEDVAIVAVPVRLADMPKMEENEPLPPPEAEDEEVVPVVLEASLLDLPDLPPIAPLPPPPPPPEPAPRAAAVERIMPLEQVIISSIGNAHARRFSCVRSPDDFKRLGMQQWRSMFKSDVFLTQPASDLRLANQVAVELRKLYVTVTVDGSCLVPPEQRDRRVELEQLMTLIPAIAIRVLIISRNVIKDPLAVFQQVIALKRSSEASSSPMNRWLSALNNPLAIPSFVPVLDGLTEDEFWSLPVKRDWNRVGDDDWDYIQAIRHQRNFGIRGTRTPPIILDKNDVRAPELVAHDLHMHLTAARVCMQIGAQRLLYTERPEAPAAPTLSSTPSGILLTFTPLPLHSYVVVAMSGDHPASVVMGTPTHSEFIFRRLLPGRRYSVVLIAKTLYGASLPSLAADIDVAEDFPSVAPTDWIVPASPTNELVTRLLRGGAAFHPDCSTPELARFSGPRPDSVLLIDVDGGMPLASAADAVSFDVVLARGSLLAMGMLCSIARAIVRMILPGVRVRMEGPSAGLQLLRAISRTYLHELIANCDDEMLEPAVLVSAEHKMTLARAGETDGLGLAKQWESLRQLSCGRPPDDPHNPSLMERSSFLASEALRLAEAVQAENQELRMALAATRESARAENELLRVQANKKIARLQNMISRIQTRQWGTEDQIPTDRAGGSVEAAASSPRNRLGMLAVQPPEVAVFPGFQPQQGDAVVEATDPDEAGLQNANASVVYRTSIVLNDQAGKPTRNFEKLQLALNSPIDEETKALLTPVIHNGYIMQMYEKKARVTSETSSAHFDVGLELIFLPLGEESLRNSCASKLVEILSTETTGVAFTVQDCIRTMPPDSVVLAVLRAHGWEGDAATGSFGTTVDANAILASLRALLERRQARKNTGADQRHCNRDLSAFMFRESHVRSCGNPLWIDWTRNPTGTRMYKQQPHDGRTRPVAESYCKEVPEGLDTCLPVLCFRALRSRRDEAFVVMVVDHTMDTAENVVVAFKLWVHRNRNPEHKNKANVRRKRKEPAEGGSAEETNRKSWGEIISDQQKQQALEQDVTQLLTRNMER